MSLIFLYNFSAKSFFHNTVSKLINYSSREGSWKEKRTTLKRSTASRVNLFIYIFNRAYGILVPRWPTAVNDVTHSTQT